jgi:hypothetical protein
VLPNLVRLDVLEDRRPLVLHVNAALLGLDHTDSWPWHLEIEVTSTRPVDDAEREALEDVAADLVEDLLGAPDVLLVARVSEPDRVRLLLRAHLEDELRAAAEHAVAAADPARPVTARIDHDPTWARSLPVLAHLAPP